ncbi:MAG TPA: putative Ig domain-containing protein [Terriglobales bacterium]
MIHTSYNSRMPNVVRWLTFLVITAGLWAQQPAGTPLTITTKELPPASLWSAYGPGHGYGFHLESEGGVGPHRWRIVSGALPQGMKLDEVSGILEGSPEETGQSEFTILLSDNIQSVKKQYTLKIETPLTVEWDQKSRVNGNRIDGSVKVSNQTGRDFDLTFIVLAVNDIGRATAIGYQHFPLQKNTRDLQLPFGDTLSSGDYNVHVDVVGEEPISNRIFRARLVSGKQSVAQSP